MSLYDRPITSQDRVLLGTGLVWRLASPLCAAADVSAVLLRMPAVEVYGVVPSLGQERSDYPFRTLLYESSSYKHLKKVHFDDCVPATMDEVCGVGQDSSPAMQVVLWNSLFVQ